MKSDEGPKKAGDGQPEQAKEDPGVKSEDASSNDSTTATVETQIPWADLIRLEGHVDEILRRTLNVINIWGPRHAVLSDPEYNSDRSNAERTAYYSLEAEVHSLRDLLRKMRHSYELRQVAPRAS